MGYRMPRKVKNMLIDYVHRYAKRILESNDKIKTINHFDTNKATEAAVAALSKQTELSDSEKNGIQSEDGRKAIKVFFDEKLIINYFMFARDISYYESKSLLTDKGLKYFPETKDIESNLYPGRFDKDYKATDKQINYIRMLGADISHEEELTGREASLIISCLKMPTKTKPAYFSYYIRKI